MIDPDEKAPPSKLPFAITPVSHEGMKTITSIIKMAIENEMISESDASSALKILTINPQTRLSKIGIRMARLQETVKDLRDMDSRMTVVAELFDTELKDLTTVINSNPLWAEGEGDERANT